MSFERQISQGKSLVNSGGGVRPTDEWRDHEHDLKAMSALGSPCTVCRKICPPLNQRYYCQKVSLKKIDSSKTANKDRGSHFISNGTIYVVIQWLLNRSVGSTLINASSLSSVLHTLLLFLTTTLGPCFLISVLDVESAKVERELA